MHAQGSSIDILNERAAAVRLPTAAAASILVITRCFVSKRALSIILGLVAILRIAHQAAVAVIIIIIIITIIIIIIIIQGRVRYVQQILS